MFHYDKTLFGSPLGIKGNYPLKNNKKKNATRRKEKERSREKRDKEIERQR